MTDVDHAWTSSLLRITKSNTLILTK